MREDKLLQVRRKVAVAPHIVIETTQCQDCENEACLYFCPAGCFVKKDDGGIEFKYEGCFECGTCRVMCEKAVKKWEYPTGGFGVAFRLG
jgi:ferredoxin like protein